MVLKGRYQASIYIQVTYTTYATYAMSKINRVSTKVYINYLRNLINARTKHIMVLILQ